MTRADHDLAFMLKYENVAWYENGAVKILDRRIYPVRTEYVVCKTYEEVAQAIKDMVTQSGGPYTAATMGMALAANSVKDKNKIEQFEYLKDAAFTLSHARPTTSAHMIDDVNACLEVAKNALESGESVEEAIFSHNLRNLDERYLRVERIAEFLVDNFPDEGTVMTQCFAETVVGMFLKVARKRGKKIKIICPETRPYFQGARLTASVAYDQGYDVTVITDNMPGYVLNEKKVDLFTSAADVISMDGYIVNKIGTFQIALAASFWGIPYYVTGNPNKHHPTIDTVKIEERDPDYVLQAMGQQTAMKGVKGYYPAFDITPPKLVTGVVTSKGIYSAFELEKFYQSKGDSGLL
jgi:methylthioribose-1-phosphate isomerase